MFQICHAVIGRFQFCINSHCNKRIKCTKTYRFSFMFLKLKNWFCVYSIMSKVQCGCKQIRCTLWNFKTIICQQITKVLHIFVSLILHHCYIQLITVKMFHVKWADNLKIFNILYLRWLGHASHMLHITFDVNFYPNSFNYILRFSQVFMIKD